MQPLGNKLGSFIFVYKYKVVKYIVISVVIQNIILYLISPVAYLNLKLSLNQNFKCQPK